MGGVVSVTPRKDLGTHWTRGWVHFQGTFWFKSLGIKYILDDFGIPSYFEILSKMIQMGCIYSIALVCFLSWQLFWKHVLLIKQ